MAAIRVYLLDDHELIRQGLHRSLDAFDDIEMVGDSSDAGSGLAEILRLQPDVAILDVKLRDVSGVDVCRRIRTTHPSIRCLMLTSYPDDEPFAAAIDAGASGYILKDTPVSELVPAIRRVAAGEVLMDDTLTKQVLERIRRGPARDPLEALTDRERTILSLIGQGLTNREIAVELSLAEQTIKNYVSNLLAKLSMQRRSQAAAFAARLGEDGRGEP